MESRARLVFQPPLGEAFQPLAAVQPFLLRVRRIGKSRGIAEELIDRDHLFAVGAELRHDIGNAFA